MNQELDKIIEKLKEIKIILEKYSSKEDAINYLIKETKLSKEECTKAYEFFTNINH